MSFESNIRLEIIKIKGKDKYCVIVNGYTITGGNRAPQGDYTIIQTLEVNVSELVNAATGNYTD